jgi:hypothetical protein
MEQKKDLYMVFIDQKEYDKMSSNVMWWVLQKRGPKKCGRHR